MTTNENLDSMQERLDEVQGHIDEARTGAEADGIIEPDVPEPTFFDPDPEHHGTNEGDDRAIAPPG
jgi:hypothetical protein